MKVKLFIFSFSIIFILVLSSCSADMYVKPPETMRRDSEAANMGNSTKSLNHTFRNGFIYHEWKGEDVQIVEIPFNPNLTRNWWLGKARWQKQNTNAKYPVKKLVTSKYFNIYVDITEGQKAFYKATNMTDVAYDKLIESLEKYYHKIIGVYGYPSNRDGNNKIEIVFHENSEGFANDKVSGYFYEYNIHKEILHTAEMDVLYINSAHFMTTEAQENKEFTNKCFETIFHELQHDIFANRALNTQNFRVRDYPQKKWINEALSESTYFVIYDGKKPSRSANFTSDTIRNGQYFFYWPRENAPSENYNTASHFMYWLYLHGGGNQIIRDIIFIDPNKLTDIKSIGDAARKNIPYFKNITANESTIVKTWYMANLLNETDSIYGYKGKTTVNVDYANDSKGYVDLNGYCAVYTSKDMEMVNSSQNGIYLEVKNDNLLIFNYSIVSSENNRDYYSKNDLSKPELHLKDYKRTDATENAYIFPTKRAYINPYQKRDMLFSRSSIAQNSSLAQNEDNELIDYVVMYGE